MPESFPGGGGGRDVKLIKRLNLAQRFKNEWRGTTTYTCAFFAYPPKNVYSSNSLIHPHILKLGGKTESAVRVMQGPNRHSLLRPHMADREDDFLIFVTINIRGQSTRGNPPACQPES
jgi:hypothetical protein